MRFTARYMPRSGELSKLLLLTLGHLVLMYWALTLVTPEEGIALMWLPDGFLLGVLVLLPRRLWGWQIGLIVVTVVAIESIMTPRPLLMIVMFVFANLLNSILGALLVTAYAGGQEGMRSFKQLSMFILLCVILVPAISAGVGAYTVQYHGVSDDFWAVYQTWHSAAAIGILIMAPWVIEGWRWFQGLDDQLGYNYRSLLPVLLATFCTVVLAAALSQITFNNLILYLSLPLLCWSAVKFGLKGGLCTATILVVMSVQLTAWGVSPYTFESMTAAESVFALQGYLGTAILSSFYAAVAVDNLRILSFKLDDIGSGYKALFENSPTALWEEDFSAVHAYIEALKDAGVKDIAQWLEEHPDVVLECARKVKVKQVNSRALEMFMATSEQLKHTLDVVIKEETLAIFREEITAFAHGRTRFSAEAIQYRLNGDPFYTLTSAVIVPGCEHNWSNVIVSVEDIDSRKHSELQLLESQKQLRQLAHYDALTQLPNRVLFYDRLHQAIQHASRQKSQLAVMFIDLDRFKHVNDSLGHSSGDQLLAQVAQQLSSCLRSEDAIARISGDEFAVIITEVQDRASLCMVAEKLLHAIKTEFMVFGHRLRINASLGISLFPEDAVAPEELISQADAAMYRAKEEGRNTYRFYMPEMTAKASEYVQLEHALHQAIPQHQLYLVFQPQMDMRTGQCVGVEALLRWRHPEFGAISPDRFIPIAEQNGLIKEIGAWALTQACRQMRLWREAGYTFGRMAINVSGQQLHDHSFQTLLIDTLNQHGLSAQDLELEVTESVLMKEGHTGIHQLTALRELGVEVAIDDFGTGYSSLSYLKHLPIDRLKIDRSFMYDTPHDPDNAAIVQAIIALGRSLEKQVIAEGVETEVQAAFLQQQGCYLAQGYLYSHPLAAADMPQFLASI